MDYDVIIIGGRIAGSLAAARLGQAGKRVLVLERARFPSDTLSTHFFRAPTFRALAAVEAYDEIQALAPHLTVNYNVIDGIVFPEPVDRPEDFPFYMNMRRITLDELLVRNAERNPNVEFREAAKATRLLREDGHVTGVEWNESEGSREATARAVVGADGVHSFVAKEVEAQVEHEAPVQRAMYYAYFRGVQWTEGPGAEFHYRGNTLGYCMPCDAGLTLLAVSVPIAEFGEFRSDPEGKLMRELNLFTDLASRIDKAERESRVLGSGSIPGRKRVPFGNGWALVGDAGMVMDPWSGQGIDQASTHAVLLAGRLGEFLDGKADWQAAMQAYHRERNEFSEKTYRRTTTFAADLRPMTREALLKRGLKPAA